MSAEMNHQCGKKELLVTYLYEEATPAERSEFEQHLTNCNACQTELHSFCGVRTELQKWPLPFVPPIEVVTPRPALDVLREFFRLVPGWFKVTSGLAATAAAALLLFALTNARISFGMGGFDAQFGGNSAVTKAELPKPVTGNFLSRAEAEQLIQTAVAQAQAQAHQQTQLQLASLEAKLTAAHQAQLQAATQRLRQEHQRRLQLELAKFDNGTRQTLTEWLLTSTDTGQEASDEKNH
jgi:anti-sigma factor RsiW